MPKRRPGWRRRSDPRSSPADVAADETKDPSGAGTADAIESKAPPATPVESAVGQTPPPEEDPGEETEGPGRLSWLERRQASRVARAAKEIALPGLAAARKQMEQELEERISAETSQAAQAMEARLEKAREGFTGVLQEARQTVQRLRDQVSEAKQQDDRLNQSGAEVRAHAAAAQETVRGVLEEAVQRLTAHADEQVDRVTESVHEGSDLAQSLRKEFSARIESAVKRLDRNTEELDARAADLKREGTELDSKLAAAAERVAAWQRATREEIDKAIRELKGEGDQQAERLDGRVELLEAQRARLQQQSTQVQEESAAAREQAVALEELVKNTAAELAARVDAAERELDRRLADAKSLFDAAVQEREQERERWEQMRADAGEELERSMREVREFFLVQLAVIKSRVEAVAEARGLAPPGFDETESAIAEWAPDAPAEQASEDVDLNSAGISELRSLGLTTTQARRVIGHRERNGRFESVEELDEIPGLTGEQRAMLKHRSIVR